MERAPTPVPRQVSKDHVAALVTWGGRVLLVHPNEGERGWWILPQMGAWDTSGTLLDTLLVLLDCKLHLRPDSFIRPQKSDVLVSFDNPVPPSRSLEFVPGGVKTVHVFPVQLTAMRSGLNRQHYSSFTWCDSWASLAEHIALLRRSGRERKWAGVVSAVIRCAQSGTLDWTVPDDVQAIAAKIMSTPLPKGGHSVTSTPLAA